MIFGFKHFKLLFFLVESLVCGPAGCDLLPQDATPREEDGEREI